MRGSVAAPYRDACARQRGAVRLRPLGSTATRGCREKIDVTDPHLRAAGGDVIPALTEPYVEDRRINTDLAGGAGPAGQHLHLDLAGIGAEAPVGAALQDRQARLPEPPRPRPRRLR